MDNQKISKTKENVKSEKPVEGEIIKFDNAGSKTIPLMRFKNIDEKLYELISLIILAKKRLLSLW